MGAETNYPAVWLVYLAAGLVFYGLFWRMTAPVRRRWLRRSARAVTAAVILTPAYTSEQSGTMAPALMVMALDAIAIGPGAATRALAPLVLGVIGAEIAVAAAHFAGKRRRRP